MLRSCRCALIFVGLVGLACGGRAVSPPQPSAEGAPQVLKIDPPNWWVGHSVDPVRPLIRGRNLSHARVELEGTRLRASNVHSSAAGSYLFVDLTIGRSSKLGRRSLKFINAASSTDFPFDILAPLPRPGRFQGFSPDDFIYEIMPDRFSNGDPSNDNPPQSPGLLFYQFNKVENEFFEESLRCLTQDFTYARYKPLAYYAGPKRESDQRDRQAQLNLARFMKILMVKRLESSFYVFRESIGRFISSYERMIAEFHKGNVYISKEYINKIFDLLEQDDQEPIDRLLAEEKAERLDAKDLLTGQSEEAAHRTVIFRRQRPPPARRLSNSGEHGSAFRRPQSPPRPHKSASIFLARTSSHGAVGILLEALVRKNQEHAQCREGRQSQRPRPALVAGLPR
jgi:hypothetical protein